jgi:hypothetical protein
MGAKKRNQTLSRIEYSGDADWIDDVDEVLERGGIGAEKTGYLDGSDDDAFRSGLHRGGRHGWDQCRHPDLQARRVDASSFYVPPPWTPSCRRGGAGETLAWGVDRDGGDLEWWRGQGNPSVGWCVGVLI